MLDTARVFQLTLTDYAATLAQALEASRVVRCPTSPPAPAPLSDPDVMAKRTRRADYTTSIAGAQKASLSAGSQKRKLLEAYLEAGPDGLTDEQAAEGAGIPRHICYWKRCNELRTLAYIEIIKDKDGEIVTRKGMSGVTRMVCRITQNGTGALKEHRERTNQ